MFAPLRNENNFNAINQIHEFLAANVQKKNISYSEILWPKQRLLITQFY